MLAVALALVATGFTLARAGIKGKDNDVEIWREPWAPIVEWLGGKKQTAPGTDRPKGVPVGPGLDEFGNPIPGVVPGATGQTFRPAAPAAGVTQGGFRPAGTPGVSPSV